MSEFARRLLQEVAAAPDRDGAARLIEAVQEQITRMPPRAAEQLLSELQDLIAEKD